MSNKSLVKLLGWTTVISGVAYVYLSSKSDEPHLIEGFNIDIDANKLIDSGLNEISLLGPNIKDKLGTSAKRYLGRVLNGEVVND